MSNPNPYPALPTEAENQQQAALYAWFTTQQTKAVDNLEEAARQIITLCTTLLGLLLGLLALTETPLPAHMGWSGVQWLGGVGVTALLLALAAALSVVIPRPTAATLNDPDDLERAFAALLARKNQGLWWAVLLFGTAMGCLAAVVVAALALLV
ncbi:MAG: hypothetical protein IAE79_14450 [Anaerolinea sp.]|nr:hypothetical protein [Anaerolinea sp.]